MMDNLEFLNSYAEYVKQDLSERLKSGAIKESDYNKGIVTLSYEFFLHGHIENGLLLLSEVNEQYYMNFMVGHLEDMEFYKKCFFIFEILDWKGYISYDVFATQKKGSA